jgi:hypothetical protein
MIDRQLSRVRLHAAADAEQEDSTDGENDGGGERQRHQHAPDARPRGVPGDGSLSGAPVPQRIGRATAKILLPRVEEFARGAFRRDAGAARRTALQVCLDRGAIRDPLAIHVGGKLLFDFPAISHQRLLVP